MSKTDPAARLAEPRDGNCAFCNEPTDSFAADPGKWPIWFPHPDGTGVTKAHHVGCVTRRLFDGAEAQRVLEPEAACAAMREAAQPFANLPAKDKCTVVVSKNGKKRLSGDVNARVLGRDIVRLRNALAHDAGRALLAELERLRLDGVMLCVLRNVIHGHSATDSCDKAGAGCWCDDCRAVREQIKCDGGISPHELPAVVKVRGLLTELHARRVLDEDHAEGCPERTNRGGNYGCTCGLAARQEEARRVIEEGLADTKVGARDAT